MKIKKALSSLIFKIIRWKVVGERPKDCDKCLFICGPHTSNWDLIYGLLASYIWEMNFKFIIKSEIMFFPLNIILKSLGAIPINRNRDKTVTNSNIDVICEKIKNIKNAGIAISPKGTRKKTEKLKTGFYYIAKKANIPICLAYVDYKKKEIGISEPYFVGDSIDEEINKISDFYKNITPKHIERNFEVQ